MKMKTKLVGAEVTRLKLKKNETPNVVSYE
jgi:hypothetical protein